MLGEERSYRGYHVYIIIWKPLIGESLEFGDHGVECGLKTLASFNFYGPEMVINLAQI